MSEIKKVKIVETPDCYLVIDIETGEFAEGSDRFGFSYESSAAEWAARRGYQVVERPF